MSEKSLSTQTQIDLYQPLREKIRRDLESGFHLDSDEENFRRKQIYVITRNSEGDIFEIDANLTTTTPIMGGELFQKEEVNIRRKPRTLRGPGSGTMERYSACATTQKELTFSYRIQPEKGGCLSEEEFLGRYRQSIVDRELTEELRNLVEPEFRARQAEYERVRARWRPED